MGLPIVNQINHREKHYDAVIVGAGPAGLACAIGLALRLQRVAIIDSGVQPQDKACGEGLMAAGLTHLKTLGIDVDKLAGMPLLGVTYIDGPRRLALDWAKSPALGLRRTALSEAMWKRALAVGVHKISARVSKVIDGHESAQVWAGTSLLQAKLVVGADGLHSIVRRAIGKNRKKSCTSHKRMGLRQHFYLAPWSQHVEVYLANGVEAYVTPVSHDIVGVAVLGPTIKQGLMAALVPFSGLYQRLQFAQCASEQRGAGPLHQKVMAVTGHRVALVGDASGYLDALTGEGLTLALGEAALLCRTIAEKRSLDTYAAGHLMLTARYRYSVRALLWLGRHSRIRSVVIWLAGLCPCGASALARWITHLPQ